LAYCQEITPPDMNSPDVFAVFIGNLVLTFIAIAIIGFIVYYQRRQFKNELKRRKELRQLDANYQKQLLQSSLEVQELVRKNIAKDLHDEIGGLLSATKLSILKLSKNVNKDKTLDQEFDISKKLIEEALVQVRSLSRELVPQTLERFGFIPALKEFISKIEVATDISFSFYHENPDRFSDAIELAVYRIVQELTNNSIKHAKCKHIRIDIRVIDNQLVMLFEDDGKGYDIEYQLKQTQSGLGLWNIISRISAVDGEYDFENVRGIGCKIKISIPI
jgi:signal transduction histidine kinase